MTKEKLRIRRFNIDTLRPTSTVLVVGKRNTGKSVVLRNLLYHLRDRIDATVVFSPTEAAQGAFSQFVPPTMIHEEFSGSRLDLIMKTQREQWGRVGKNGQHVMVVMDDCGFDKKVFNGKPLRNLFYNGRHNKCGLLLSVQYALDMPATCRSNVDLVICCRESVRANRERLYKNFFGQFESFEAFNKCMMACTNNFECLCLDNSSTSNKITDCVFWWKASMDLPHFRLGALQWEMHEMFERRAGDDDADDEMKVC